MGLRPLGRKSRQTVEVTHAAISCRSTPELRATRTEPVKHLSIKGQWRLETTGHEAEDSKQTETSYSQDDPATAGPRGREVRRPQQPFVKEFAAKIGMGKLAPHDLRRSCARRCRAAGGELEQIQFLLGHVSVQTTERYLGCTQRISSAVNDCIGIEPKP